MKRLKKYKGIIMGFIIGGIVTSSITVCAMIGANSVTYTNDKTVEAALNELYTKIPKGTKTITEKGNQIDVGAYKYADTTGLYTQNEVQTGKGVHWDSGTFNISNSYGYTLSKSDMAFTPSSVIIYGYKEGAYFIIVKDNNFCKAFCHAPFMEDIYEGWCGDVNIQLGEKSFNCIFWDNNNWDGCSAIWYAME